MSGFMADFTRCIDNTRSMFEISLMLQQAVDEAKKVTGRTAMHKTLLAFEGSGYQKMINLLHYLHPRTLKAIVRGTLAYEYMQDPEFRMHQYNGNEVAGTYAVSMCIEHRKGRFLNGQELELLASFIEDYVSAATACRDNGWHWDANDISHGIHETFVQQVDGAYSLPTNGRPKFAKTDAALEKLTELAAMFGRRINRALDPGGLEHQIQAPMMIGCTSEIITERTKDHAPHYGVLKLANLASCLENTTNTWGLTLSIIKSCLHLEPEVVHMAALAIFDSEDLPLSEMLLTTVAQSLVWQTGFNIIQGGGEADREGRGFKDEKNVCYDRTFLSHNLQCTLKRIQHIRNNMAISDILKSMDLDSLDVQVKELQQAELELGELVEKYTAAKKALDKDDEEARATVAKAEAAIHRLKEFTELCEILTRVALNKK